jgi:hypothetical protein
MSGFKKGFHVFGAGDAGWMGSLDGVIETYEKACVAAMEHRLINVYGEQLAVEVCYSDGIHEGLFHKDVGGWRYLNEFGKQDASVAVPETLK